MGNAVPDSNHDYSLSPNQRRIWWQQRERSDALFSADTWVRYAGTIDSDRLRDVLVDCTRAHPLLRTAFVPVEGMRLPALRTLPAGAPDLAVHDLRAVPMERREAELDELRKRGLARPYDDRSGTLLRVRVAQLDEDDARIWIAAPAACVDAVSVSMLAREILMRYAGTAPDAPEGPGFELVAAWQNQVLETPEAVPGLGFWRTQMASPPPRPLPGGHGGETADFAPRSVSLELSAETAAALSALAGRLGVGQPAPYLAAWAALLAQHLDHAELTVGWMLDGRDPELAGFVGPMTALVPLVLRVDCGASMRELVSQAGAQAVLAERWRDAYDPDWRAELGALPHEAYTFAFEASSGTSAPAPAACLMDHRFELRLVCVAGTGASSVLRLDYDSTRYPAPFAQRLLERYEALVESMGEDLPARGWHAMVGRTERAALMGLNRTEREFGPAECLHTLFERQARRTPQRCAVLDRHGATTYAELESAANRWARYLAQRGIGVESRVGICMERTSTLVALMLGVLKAGACYLLIEPGDNAERLAMMAAGCRLDLLVCDKPSEGFNLPCLDLGKAMPDLAGYSDAPTGRSVSPVQLAYLIHTSGTTGTPKAIGVEHRALCNHMHWMQQDCPLGDGDRVLQKTPVGFDAAVWEYHAPLLSGAVLVLPPHGIEREPEQLAAWMKEYAITRIQLVPALLRALSGLEAVARCIALREVFCGGEPLTADDVLRFRARHPARLHNLYGPAEACIDTCAFTLAEEDTDVPPIGTPIANVRVHLLDMDGAPVPFGVEGELCIAGAALARGYLDAPALTAAHFVPDPFGSPGARMYLSGDVARHRADGLLEYVGRRDDQVKIGGARTSTAAIENVVSGAPGVAQCVVLVDRAADRGARLVAYVQPTMEADGPSLDSVIRRFAAAHLPSYQIPSQIVTVERFALLPSGKIDRGALRLPTAAALLAYRTETERKIVEVWSEVLGVDQIGVDDNFFQLGGHSILFTQVVLRLRDVFACDIPLRSIFDAPTPATLAALIDALVLDHADRELASLLDEVERMPDDAPALRSA